MSDKILESGTVHVQDIQMGKKKISDVKIANDEVLFIIFRNTKFGFLETQNLVFWKHKIWFSRNTKFVR